MATKIQEYRPLEHVARGSSNFIRIGDIVKAKRPGKNSVLGEVTEIQAGDDGYVTGVFVLILSNLQGKIIGDHGKWRCLGPECISRVAQTSKAVKDARATKRSAA